MNEALDVLLELHITDMSWGRISHPSEVVNIDDEIEVMVLKVDKDRERIALGIKQKESPTCRFESVAQAGTTVPWQSPRN